MLQVLQSLRSGEIEVVEAPAPSVRAGHVLIETRASLISAGTERMLLEFGRANLIQKALQQPDRVKQTLTKMKTDGIGATLEAVKHKLDEPIPLGYCSAGVVIAVGAGVDHLSPGDRVVSNAPHGEIGLVGKNLVARIPDEVDFDSACFTPLAAIALQGIRLAKPTLGETFCVMGLGLVGLLSVQILRANGCRVIGMDFNKARLDLAESWGAIPVDLNGETDAADAALGLTEGVGVDGVIVAASTTSSDPISQSARMSRKRGRVVLVGVTGLELARDEWYEKELTFQVSCSYGPGRYDPDYEGRGNDYPLGFVRWTEQRNFQAVLELMADKNLDVSAMMSGSVPVSKAKQAYDRLSQKGASDLGLLIHYDRPREDRLSSRVPLTPVGSAPKGDVGVALIGAGNFGGRVTAPGLKAAGARLKTIVSRGGVSAVVRGRSSGFEEASADMNAALADPDIDAVAIVTGHNSHAYLTCEALDAGKHVFVEKPLGLTQEEIDKVEASLRATESDPRQLMVGFNRRFSPFSIRAKELLDQRTDPVCLIATINAGAIPAGHWAQDKAIGGGRILGEMCHFLDLFRYWVGAPITGVESMQIGRPAADGIAEDKASFTFSFADGSIGTIHYFANGPKSLSKERYEGFVGGRHFLLDNFQSLSVQGWDKKSAMKGKQDKGHAATLAAFIEAIRKGEPCPIPHEELIEVSRWTIRAADAAIKGES